MVLKSEIKKSVEEQRKLVIKKETGEKRDALKKVKLLKEFIIIITGIRRCGKSTLLSQLIASTKDKYAYLNFEDPRIYDFKTSDFSKLSEVFGDDVSAFFFDEIQNVENWEIFIRNLHDKQNKICITGSNAQMLSKELGTRLTGRYLQLELFPFSYKEFLQFKKLKRNEASFKEYLNEGGFPDYLKTGNKEVLQHLFNDIVYRDIVARHGIRNVKTFIDICLFLISNAAKEYSLNGIKKSFGVGSANTVADYMQWLEDSYMLFSLPRFSWSAKSISVNPKKVYVIDAGFAHSNSLSFSEDSGRLFENLVYLELRRKHKELYYFKEKGECDFVIKEGKKITAAIQVCLEVDNDNLHRETAGLFEAMEFFKLKEGKIITLNQDDVITEKGKEIKLIPAWKWFE
jgi:uncharacterized protein